MCLTRRFLVKLVLWRHFEEISECGSCPSVFGREDWLVIEEYSNSFFFFLLFFHVYHLCLLNTGALFEYTLIKLKSIITNIRSETNIRNEINIRRLKMCMFCYHLDNPAALKVNESLIANFSI